jgi:hypothetical protein
MSWLEENEEKNGLLYVLILRRASVGIHKNYDEIESDTSECVMCITVQ